jgi:hypothetical protein
MDKIERVARAICEAKGKDPDSDSGRGQLMTVTRSSSAFAVSYSQEREALPNWRLFEADAAVFVAAHRALETADDEAPLA